MTPRFEKELSTPHTKAFATRRLHFAVYNLAVSNPNLLAKSLFEIGGKRFKISEMLQRSMPGNIAQKVVFLLESQPIAPDTDKVLGFLQSNSDLELYPGAREDLKPKAL